MYSEGPDFGILSKRSRERARRCTPDGTRAGQRTLECCVTGSVFFPSLQKLAFYSKMQEAPESGSSAGSSFSSHPAASIKEEDCSPEKERPPEAEYISSRCVLFTYFQGDISAVVDEHFSRALSQPSSFSLGSAKAARNAGSWRGERPSWRGDTGEVGDAGGAGGVGHAGGCPLGWLLVPSSASHPGSSSLPPAAGVRQAPLGSQARSCQLLDPFRVKKERIKPFRLCRGGHGPGGKQPEKQSGRGETNFLLTAGALPGGGYCPTSHGVTPKL